MITCRELISFLIDYLDGSLSADERVRFEKHLALCESCTAYLRTYEMTIRLEQAAGLEECEVPEELVKAVMDSRSI